MEGDETNQQAEGGARAWGPRDSRGLGGGLVLLAPGPTHTQAVTLSKLQLPV